MHHLQKNWQTLLKQPEVRDLAWAIFSPSLLDEKAAVKCMEAPFLGLDAASFGPFISHIQKLEKNPEPLRKMIQSANPKRLGDYFETLILYFLNQMPCCHKLEHKMVVKSGPKTVGEFDFLFYSEIVKKAIHWEVAVKFYLLDPSGQFRGLNPADTLSDKIITLSRQVSLPQKSEAKKFLTSHHFLPIESGVLIRGNLFYPLDEEGQYLPILHPGIAENHLFGWWDSINNEGWKKRTKAYRLMNLSRLNCLAPKVMETTPQPFIPQPGLVACMVEEDEQWVEKERGMLVPTNWPATV